MNDQVKEDPIKAPVPGQDPVIGPITIGGKESRQFGAESAPVSEIAPVAEIPEPRISTEVSQYVEQTPGAVEDFRLTTDQQQAGISNSGAYASHPTEPSGGFDSISSLNLSQLRNQIRDARSDSFKGKLQVALRQILRPKNLNPEPVT
ncbi:MAG: hypothetical protein HY426_04380 [Candidatus Levybacteria bacterium]|nr:hypothetical protein [Candidatus Levybacteria bacterium]